MTGGVFDGDAGFLTGHALATAAGNKDKLKLAEALGDERAQNEQLRAESSEHRNARLNDIRVHNLIVMAAYEYDNFVAVDVSNHLADACSKLKSIVESTQIASKNELREILDKLNEFKQVSESGDREEWINGRHQDLMNTCRFAKNDVEALVLGGYCMPKENSIPALFSDDINALARGENIQVYRVLTDPNHKYELLPRMQKGPLKLGITV